MTTSLATLASNPLAHSSSTVIMSTQQNQSNTTTTTMNNQYQQYSSQQQQQQQQQQTLIESGEYDSSQETKTEFYTREGLWKLVKNGEFVRQQQQQQQNNNGYQMNQVTNNYGNNNNNNSNNNGMTNGQMSNSNLQTANEPVKVAFFNYSNDLIQTNQNNKFKLKNYCIKCMKIIISNQQKRIEKSNCNAKLNSNDSLSLSNTSINNNNNNSLDVVVFNYAREIYFYEFNPFNKTKV